MAETDRTFFTVTMARMMAEQGNLGRAAEIYRYLLHQNPDRDDLADALAQIDAELAAKDPYDLVNLLTEWADLAMSAGGLSRLARIRNTLIRR